MLACDERRTAKRMLIRLMAQVKADNRRDYPNYQITNNNPIDVHVGRRVRLRRTLLGMSQEQLGDALNITFQQVQKYERGSNRISASRLWDIGQILDVPVSFFFDDMSDRKSVVQGKSVSVRVDRGGSRIIKKKKISISGTIKR